jgi:hypothetical protein
VTQTAPPIGADIRPVTRTARVRPWIALAAAAVLLALVIVGLLPFTYAAPVIGVVLALGSPRDYAGQARPVARRTRNAVVGVALIAALGVVIWQPQLTLPLVLLAGMDSSGLVVTVVAVIALALPLAMTDATSDELPAGWFLLTRRNLILSLTILVSVATWYGALGHSFIPIAVFVLVLPMLIGLSRLVAARKGRLEYGLLREPLRPGLGPHRLQLVNVVLFCGLAALTVSTGAYEAIALQLPGVYRVLLTLFFTCLVAFVLLALLPAGAARLERVGGGRNDLPGNPADLVVPAARRRRDHRFSTGRGMVGRSWRARRTDQLPPHRVDATQCRGHHASRRGRHSPPGPH